MWKISCPKCGAVLLPPQQTGLQRCWHCHWASHESAGARAPAPVQRPVERSQGRIRKPPAPVRPTRKEGDSFPATPKADGAYDVFVSYAHVDNRQERAGFVGALVAAVEREYQRMNSTPLRVFFDLSAIRSMDDWEDRIHTGLRESRVMIALLSPAYFTSEYCFKEWQRYVDYELQYALPGQGIAPIYIETDDAFEKCEVDSSPTPWLQDLRRRQFLDCRPWWPEAKQAVSRDDVRRQIAFLEDQIADRLRRGRLRDESPSTIPPHNDRFVGRREELRRLREHLAKGRIRAIAAVQGLGGIGKSALAFEYAHLYGDEYPGGRFLLPGDTRDLRAAVISLAPHKGVPLSDEELRQPRLAFEKVRAKFEQGPRSLLVVDNVDDPKTFGSQIKEGFLPSGTNVHVVLTTRLPADSLAEIPCLTLQALPIADAVDLIRRYRPFMDQAADHKCAQDVAEYLGGHPLALEIVSVYLGQNPEVALSAFWNGIQEKGIELVERAGESAHGKLTRHVETSIARLFQPTLESLSGEERNAVELAALLPADNIPIPWLRHLVGHHHQEIGKKHEAWEPDPFQRLIRRLYGLRILRETDNSNVARMHRVLRGVVAGRLSEGDAVELVREINRHAQTRASFLHEHWRDRDSRWELAPLCEHAVELLRERNEDGPKLANILVEPMRSLSQLTECRQLLRQCVDYLAGNPEGNEVLLASSCSNLALLEHDFGDLASARELLARAITLDRQSFGDRHPKLAVRYSNLAQVEQDAGDYQRARELLHQAIEIDEQALSPHDPVLAIRYSNLANLENEQGRSKIARELMLKALEIERVVLDKNHPRLATRLSNLAMIERSEGDLVSAKRLLLESLSISQVTYDEDDPQMALCYSNLGLVERGLGNLAAARDYQSKALEIGMRTLPADHPELAKRYANLGAVERDLRNLNRARDLLQSALQIYERVSGADHMDVATTCVNLGVIERDCGNLSAARELLQRALGIFRAVCRGAHPMLAICCMNLSSVHQSLGDLESARELLQQAITMQRALYGDGHRDLGLMYWNLATLERACANLAGAVREGRRALEILDRCKSISPLIVARIRNDFAIIEREYRSGSGGP